MIYFDMKQGKVVMDRTESGLTDFGKQAVPHDIELAWDKPVSYTHLSAMAMLATSMPQVIS